jgi:hypothetical protein
MRPRERHAILQGRRPSRPKPQAHLNRDKIKLVLEQAFRQRFPQDTVDISDGYEDNIHVVVVSRKFDKMTEEEKQELMWKIIDSTNLTKNEKSLISLAYPVSIAEIK